MIQASAKRETKPKTAMVQSTILVDRDVVRIPAWVQDLDSFRRWYHSDDFPESGRICYLDDEVWVDMSMEQIFSHNQVKSQYNIVLGTLAMKSRLGRYFPDGVRFTNAAANLSCCPDGVFVSRATLRSSRVRLVKGAKEGFLELEGSADMTLEVLSASSVTKDTDDLYKLYWSAGVSEYWLVDARHEPIQFDIFQHGHKGYAATRKQAGWIKSAVFGKSFKLTCQDDEFGHPEYRLAMK